MNTRHIVAAFLLSFLFLFCNSELAAETVSVTELIAKGNECCSKGDTKHAAIFWEQALSRMNPEKDTEVYLDTAICLSNLYQSLGYHRKALSALHTALPLMEKSGDHYRNAMFFNSLGDLHLSLGNIEDAAEYLLKGLEQGRLAENPRALITVLNNMGNGLAADENYPGAMALFDESLELIENSPEHSDLKPKVLLNLIRLGIQMESYEDVANTLDSVLLQIAEQPDTFSKASDLITLERLIRDIRQHLNQQDSHLNQVAYAALKAAKGISEKMQDVLMTSYACGYMGQLYETQGRYSEAMTLTRQARFAVQQGDFPEVLYLWEWQLGRLFRAQGDAENAIKSYKNAIAVLNPIRQTLFKGFRSHKDLFNETVKPVYLGLTELLLDRAQTADDAETSEGYLIKARDTMEILKTAELEDFFADECLSALRSQKTGLYRAPEHTAILYPVMLPDYLVLLLTLPDRMKQIRVPVSADRLAGVAALYRERLQTLPNNRFLYESQQLYDWVIRPIEPVLKEQKADTLIIAPDGALRLIPFSTLHDREHFLIETYAVGTIPAVSLTDPKPAVMNLSDTLAAGLSESRHGFPELPGVTEEVRNIARITNTKTVMLNKDFTADTLTREFKNNSYSLLHIATHGIFGGTPKESFLLTYDDKLTMDRLEQLIGLGRFREQKVELMTLSACQTALGNERAAMGLAGVAVKAGVKTVIATLWYVDDEATSLAIGELYKELGRPGISKVKAMQNVQKKMIARRRYWHPMYWGPFLVVGNWM